MNDQTTISRLSIPAPALTQHVAVLGKTGSGKTSTAKLAVEQVVAGGARVCILDPIKSDWWGLTSSADGKQAGLPFSILGGPHGHVPLPSSAGKAIGELVASGALPLSIIDMADFESGGLQRFFIDFAQALLRGMRGVVYLVIEEAHEFAPKERSGIGPENIAIHWAKKIATAGRSKGIRLILATQRTQSLHNALLGSCETMIVHRMTAPADQKSVKQWLKANTAKDVQEQVASSLAALKTGTGWICSGEAGIFEKREFPRITTYDNSATPTATATAKDGGHREVKTATVDQDKLRDIIGSAVKEAEANDPAKLKAEIARLQVEARRASAPPTVVAPPTVDVEAARRLEHALSENGKLHARLSGVAEQLGLIVRSINDKPEPLTPPVVPPRGEGIPNRIKLDLGVAAEKRATKTSDAAPKPSAPTEGFTGPQGKILSSLGFWKSIGHEAPSREQIAAVAGYMPGSGNFGNLIGNLRGSGHVEIPSAGRVSLAPGAEFQELTKAEAVQRLLGVFNGPQRKLVDASLNSLFLEMTREELAAKTGYAPRSGNFGNLIGSLCAISVFEKPRAGSIALSDWAREVLTN